MSPHRLLSLAGLSCALAASPACQREPSERDPAAEHAPDAALAHAPHARPDADAVDRAASEGQASSTPGETAPATEPRWVLTGSLVNARDLGGVLLSDGARVAAGALFRGPPLAPLAQDGCDELAKLGIRSVVDLRTPEERATKPESACVADVAQLVETPLPVPYNVSPADYLAVMNATDSISQVFRLLADAESYPVYAHCTWGRDRTGVLVALMLSGLGASRDEIMREYLLSEPQVGAYPASLEAVLDELDRLGGIEPYLRGAGISQAELDAFRSHARAAPED